MRCCLAVAVVAKVVNVGAALRSEANAAVSEPAPRVVVRVVAMAVAVVVVAVEGSRRRC